MKVIFLKTNDNFTWTLSDHTWQKFVIYDLKHSYNRQIKYGTELNKITQEHNQNINFLSKAAISYL